MARSRINPDWSDEQVIRSFRRRFRNLLTRTIDQRPRLASELLATSEESLAHLATEVAIQGRVDAMHLPGHRREVR